MDVGYPRNAAICAVMLCDSLAATPMWKSKWAIPFSTFSRIGRPHVRAPIAITIPPTNPAVTEVRTLVTTRTPTAYPCCSRRVYMPHNSKRPKVQNEAVFRRSNFSTCGFADQSRHDETQNCTRNGCSSPGHAEKHKGGFPARLGLHFEAFSSIQKCFRMKAICGAPVAQADRAAAF